MQRARYNVHHKLVGERDRARRPKASKPEQASTNRVPPVRSSAAGEPREAGEALSIPIHPFSTTRGRGDRIETFRHVRFRGELCCKSRKLQGHDFSRKHETEATADSYTPSRRIRMPRVRSEWLFCGAGLSPISAANAANHPPKSLI
jgi:hypothetical protein